MLAFITLAVLLSGIQSRHAKARPVNSAAIQGGVEGEGVERVRARRSLLRRDQSHSDRRLGRVCESISVATSFIPSSVSLLHLWRVGAVL